MNEYIGRRASLTLIITKEMVYEYAEITGDKNPIHINSEYAMKSIFKRPIAHGMLCASMISNLLANKLPGNGTIYLGQELRFKKPVFFKDRLTAEVEIIKVIKERRQIILNTTIYKNNNEIVIEGEARVINDNFFI